MSDVRYTWPEDRLHEELALYLAYCRNAPGPVLDLACGSGRISLALAREGIDVIGLEKSEGMLRLLNRKLEEEAWFVRQRVRTLLADPARFFIRRLFPVAVMTYSRFHNLLTDEEQVSCLECVYRHLGLGGRFVVEVSPEFPDHPQTLDPAVRRCQEYPRGDWAVLEREWRYTDPLRRLTVWESSYSVVSRHAAPEADRVVEALRHVERSEMRELLERAGFANIEVIPGFERTDDRDATGRTVFVAERPLG